MVVPLLYAFIFVEVFSTKKTSREGGPSLGVTILTIIQRRESRQN
jgi:hypothetical protein